MARHAICDDTCIDVNADLAPTPQDRADLLWAQPHERPGLIRMLSSVRAHHAWRTTHHTHTH